MTGYRRPSDALTRERLLFQEEDLSLREATALLQAMALDDSESAVSDAAAGRGSVEDVIAEVICSRQPLPQPFMAEDGSAAGPSVSFTQSAAAATSGAAAEIAAGAAEADSASSRRRRTRAVGSWSDDLRVMVLQVCARHAEEVGTSLSVRKEEILAEVSAAGAQLRGNPSFSLTLKQVQNIKSTSRAMVASGRAGEALRVAWDQLSRAEARFLSRQVSAPTRSATRAAARELAVMPAPEQAEPGGPSPPAVGAEGGVPGPTQRSAAATTAAAAAATAAAAAAASPRGTERVPTPADRVGMTARGSADGLTPQTAREAVQTLAGDRPNQASLLHARLVRSQLSAAKEVSDITMEFFHQLTNDMTAATDRIVTAAEGPARALLDLIRKAERTMGEVSPPGSESGSDADYVAESEASAEGTVDDAAAPPAAKRRRTRSTAPSRRG